MAFGRKPTPLDHQIFMEREVYECLLPRSPTKPCTPHSLVSSTPYKLHSNTSFLHSLSFYVFPLFSFVFAFLGVISGLYTRKITFFATFL